MINAKIKKEDLKSILDRLKDSHRVIGPKVEDGVTVLTEIEFHDIPAGYSDHQGPGNYRISKIDRPEVFSFTVGPDSFKRFLHPSVQKMFTFKKTKKGISINPTLKEEKPLAFIGARACDLSALKLLDKVFLEGPVRDSNYASSKRDMVTIGVNCLRPGDNCFCSSLNAGPEIKDGFDIAITELNDYLFLEINTNKGREIINGIPLEEISNDDLNKKISKIEDCKKIMKKSIKVNDLPWIIYKNLEHPRWTDVVSRCLACGNCTQVCPTCFCNSSYDHLQLSGISKNSGEFYGSRIKTWDSCFSINFARVHGGNFRPSRRARYRQWMAHKLAYWIEQYGLPGCVGCGRCITWCPVGIDITEELEAIRG